MHRVTAKGSNRPNARARAVIGLFLSNRVGSLQARSIFFRSAGIATRRSGRPTRGSEKKSFPSIVLVTNLPVVFRELFARSARERKVGTPCIPSFDVTYGETNDDERARARSPDHPRVIIVIMQMHYHYANATVHLKPRIRFVVVLVAAGLNVGRRWVSVLYNFEKRCARWFCLSSGLSRVGRKKTSRFHLSRR